MINKHGESTFGKAHDDLRNERRAMHESGAHGRGELSAKFEAVTRSESNPIADARARESGRLPIDLDKVDTLDLAGADPYAGALDVTGSGQPEVRIGQVWESRDRRSRGKLFWVAGFESVPGNTAILRPVDPGDIKDRVVALARFNGASNGYAFVRASRNP